MNIDENKYICIKFKDHNSTDNNNQVSNFFDFKSDSENCIHMKNNMLNNHQDIYEAINIIKSSNGNQYIFKPIIIFKIDDDNKYISEISIEYKNIFNKDILEIIEDESILNKLVNNINILVNNNLKPKIIIDRLINELMQQKNDDDDKYERIKDCIIENKSNRRLLFPIIVPFLFYVILMFIIFRLADHYLAL